MRGSVNSQVGHIWNQIDGIGQSKASSRADSDLKSLGDNKSVSDKVHSFAYKDEVMRTAQDLGNFARENFGEKNYEKIDGEIVLKWIEGKVAEGVSQGTLSNYVSHLAKVEIALEKIAQNAGRERTGFSRDDLREARDFAKENAIAKDYINRAYEAPGAIISNLEGKDYVAGRLQLEYGLRVAEATRISESQINGNVLTFSGKGGIEQTKELPIDLIREIRENMENGRFFVDQNHFRMEIKESARIEGEKYNGSHGLR
jgi:integrase